MLIENINYMTKHFPDTWKILKTFVTNREVLDSVGVVESKKQLPTLTFNKDGTDVFIHSKYDPVQEAESLVAKYLQDQDVAKYKQVFFYGVGLGYHIEVLLSKYPKMNYTLFEPSPAILHAYLSQKKLMQLPLKGLKNIFLDIDAVNTVRFISSFVNLLLEDVLFITLPSYQRIFAEQYDQFHSAFIQILTQTKRNLLVNNAYEKKWVLNGIANFKEVLNTPNLIANFKNQFTAKPAIIVAAGPSTDDEIENLRRIKQEGLAYIFAAGSGLVPLITNDIIPDATFVYDPNDNLYVFQKQLERGITSIPLFFGSSVGPDIFPHYQGPKMHMVICQDTVSRYYLKYLSGEELDVMDDASTVTIVAIRILAQLGFNPILLVGQNLAYRNQVSRAGGIDYYEKETSANSLQNLFPVESVDGEIVYTSNGFNNMRKDLEKIIGLLKNVEVINTTVGGAKITGIEFIPLREILEQRLNKRIVEERWWQMEQEAYDFEFLLRQHTVMDAEYCKLENCFASLDAILKTMERLGSQKNKVQLAKSLAQFDKQFINMQHNHFFKVFLKPMRRVEFDLVIKQIHQFAYESNILLKAQRVVNEVGLFVRGCQAETQLIMPLYRQLQEVIKEKVKEEVETPV